MHPPRAKCISLVFVDNNVFINIMIIFVSCVCLICLIHFFFRMRQPLQTHMCVSGPYLRMSSGPFSGRTDVIYDCDIKAFVSPVTRSG